MQLRWKIWPHGVEKVRQFCVKVSKQVGQEQFIFFNVKKSFNDQNLFWDVSMATEFCYDANFWHNHLMQ